MMPRPLLEASTEQRLQQIIAQPPHALLLSGPLGVGKTTVATWLSEQLYSGPHQLLITSDGGKAIGIEVVRELEHFVSLKLPTSASAINRLVLIYDAHLLTTEAQNAILKTLEEPPQGTVIILTSSHQESLLPTIRSRVQGVEVQKPAATTLEQALAGNGDVKRIMALSGGLPGLAFALAQNEQDHPLVQAALTARQVLQASNFEKLTLVDGLAKDKSSQTNVLYMLMQMAHAALLTGRSTDRWQKVLKAAYQTEADITSGTQPKLALTNLMLSL